MQDVMCDLETLGNSAGCAILSIGAVAFDPETGELGEEFYKVVNTSSCVVAGLAYDQDTLDWWKKQSPEARQVLRDANHPDSAPLIKALHEFSRYLHAACGGKAVRLWGNGADFDNPILATAYKRCRIETPWKFWDSRCYRTLKNLHPDVPLPKRTGTHHNALDDAKTQAEHALLIFAQRLKALQMIGDVVDRVAAIIDVLEEPDLIG
jgi:exodeoxyribonuclease VIII